MCAESLQSRPTLCHPMDYSLPGSSARGILQARILDGWQYPPSGDLSNPGIEPMSFRCLLHWQAGFSPLSHLGRPQTQEEP